MPKTSSGTGRSPARSSRSAVASRKLGAKPMKGGGYYDEHAQRQHAAVERTIPLVERAVAQSSVPLDAPFVIADYGSATGRGSFAPVRAALALLDARQTVVVVHNDQPANDFAALLRTVATDPASYLRTRRQVYPRIAAGSFFQQVLPADFVHLGVCSSAAHWLSAVTVRPGGHVWCRSADDPARRAWRQQARRDWRAFIEHRATELVVGGALVVVLATSDEWGDSGAEGFVDVLDDALGEMVNDGELRRSERRRLVLPLWFRSDADLREPFARGATAKAMRLLYEETFELVDPHWTAYEQTGDRRAFARAHTGWLRGFTEPALLAALDPDSSPAVRQRLADACYERIERKVALDPEAVRCRWRMTALLAVRSQ